MNRAKLVVEGRRAVALAATLCLVVFGAFGQAATPGSPSGPSAEAASYVDSDPELANHFGFMRTRAVTIGAYGSEIVTAANVVSSVGTSALTPDKANELAARNGLYSENIYGAKVILGAEGLRRMFELGTGGKYKVSIAHRVSGRIPSAEIEEAEKSPDLYIVVAYLDHSAMGVGGTIRTADGSIARVKVSNPVGADGVILQIKAKSEYDASLFDSWLFFRFERAALASSKAASPPKAEPSPAPAGKPVDEKALLEEKWFASVGLNNHDDIRFFALDPEDARSLYLRRFATPSIYLDAYSEGELKVLLWPEAKKRSLDMTAGAASFTRRADQLKAEYRRVGPAGASPYEGDWEIGAPAMTASIRSCEKRDWRLVMYFPGDPLSAIPMGYYPLYRTPEGRYRSSSALGDSALEVGYDPTLDTLVIKPLFAGDLDPALYDPVRAWRGK